MYKVINGNKDGLDKFSCQDEWNKNQVANGKVIGLIFIGYFTILKLDKLTEGWISNIIRRENYSRRKRRVIESNFAENHS